jgi:hypothetical protein
MKHGPLGISPTKTDTVARAMDILKDRPMPEPKARVRESFSARSRPPAKPPSSS